MEKLEKKREEKNNFNNFNDIIEETLNEGENENSTKFIENSSNNNKLDLSIKNKNNNLNLNKFETTKDMRLQIKKGNISISKKPNNNFNLRNSSDFSFSPKKRKATHMILKDQLKSPTIKFPKDNPNPKFDKNYFTKNPPQLFTKRQKTLKLNVIRIT